MTKADRRAAIINEILRLLSEERQRQGLSLNRLAAQSGLNQSTLSRLEGLPESNPTLDSLLRVAEELDLNLGELLQRAIRDVQPDAKTGRGKSLR